MTEEPCARTFPWFKATILLFFLLIAVSAVAFAYSPLVRGFFGTNQEPQPAPPKGGVENAPAPDNLIREAPPGLGDPNATPPEPVDDETSNASDDKKE